MGVDLNNLNLTLDQFNAAASGKYNIGQLKLSEDGTSVYRTNNHKTWTIFNNTPISSEESLALKTSFCQALASEGLSPEEINSVKEKLGIAGNAIDVMKAGAVKPLSAADVRQIIDEYAGRINDNRSVDGAARLETSADIYKGVGEKTMKSRETTRNSINTRTIESMVSEADVSVNTVLDILQYTGEGESETLSILQKGIANELSSIMNKAGNLPDKRNPIQLQTTFATLHEADDAKIALTFMLEGGNTFTVNTGLEREELLAQMNKVLSAKAGDAGKTDGEGREIREPKAESGKVENKVADKVKKQKPLSAKQNQIIDDLNSALDFLNPKDRLLFDSKVEKKRQSLIDEHLQKLEAARLKQEGKPSAAKLKTPDELMADEKFQGTMAAKAKDEVRSKAVKNVIEPLQKELHRLRGLDEKNVALVNKVRHALTGGEADRDALIDEIKLAFTTEVVNPYDKVMEEIKNGVKDNLEENFNINAWLGQ